MGIDLAVKLGTFLGAVLGEALKICGPVLEEIIARAIRRAATTSYEVSQSDDALTARLGDDVARLRGDGVASGNSPSGTALSDSKSSQS